MGGHREGFDTRPGLARQARFFRTDQERAAVVGAAIDYGVTYFDTTFGCELVSLGQSPRLLGRRAGLFVSGMRVDFLSNFLASADRYGADVRRYTRDEVDARLAESGLAYLDQFMLGALEVGDPLAHQGLLDDALDELARLRTAGKLRYYGFSCHDHELAARILDRFPSFDAVMAAYNYGNRKAEASLFDAVARHGTAFVAMKPLVWAEYGIPVTALRGVRPAPGWTHHDPTARVAELALRWLLGNPRVTTTVPAMNAIAEVEENAAATEEGQSLSAADEATLAGYREATQAANHVPLAIGGLRSDNLRLRGHGLRVADRQLGLGLPPIDFEADDAEQQASAQAALALDAMRRDARTADYLRQALPEA